MRPVERPSIARPLGYPRPLFSQDLDQGLAIAPKWTQRKQMKKKSRCDKRHNGFSGELFFKGW
jgi:hypothetical protein